MHVHEGVEAQKCPLEIYSDLAGWGNFAWRPATGRRRLASKRLAGILHYEIRHDLPASETGRRVGRRRRRPASD